MSTIVETTNPETGNLVTTSIHKIYIRATAQAIWDAITDPEWTNRYGYTGYYHYDLTPGAPYTVTPNDEFKAAAEEHGFPCPDILLDGEVVEAVAPHRLVTTWRMLMDPTIAGEGFSQLTQEIKEYTGFCSLTVSHQFENQPASLSLVRGENAEVGEGGGGHDWILSDLKSLLETGTVLAG